MHACIHTYMHTYTTYIHYIHTYIHYMHTCVQIYIHTRRGVKREWSCVNQTVLCVECHSLSRIITAINNNMFVSTVTLIDVIYIMNNIVTEFPY
jgi:hypothetical protein